MRTIRFATFLAPILLPTYRFITHLLGQKLACPTELLVGTSYEQMLQSVDAGFVCGLAYVKLVRQPQAALEPLVAPILRGDRYGGKAVYFSDVIVHRDSPYYSFGDLRGRSWCYNERLSQSGYGVTKYHLAMIGETMGFFGEVIEAGYHHRSIRLVSSGKVDAATIDSHVLALAFRHHSDLAAYLRIIETLGPSTIQPIVVSRRLPRSLRREMRAALIEMHADSTARDEFDRALIQRFTSVNDDSYADIRAMQNAADAMDRSTWVQNGLAVNGGEARDIRR